MRGVLRLIASASLFASSHIHQPTDCLVTFSGCDLKHRTVLDDVMDALADFDESCLLEALDVGAVNVRRAGFSAVRLSVPTLEGEFDALFGLAEMRLEILSGDRGEVMETFDSYYLENGHEAIVDRDVWDKVQKKLEANQEMEEKVGHRGGRPHFLYGTVFCGNCGNPMVRRTVNGIGGEK